MKHATHFEGLHFGVHGMLYIVSDHLGYDKMNPIGTRPPPPPHTHTRSRQPVSNSRPVLLSLRLYRLSYLAQNEPCSIHCTPDVPVGGSRADFIRADFRFSDDVFQMVSLLLSVSLFLSVSLSLPSVSISLLSLSLSLSFSVSLSLSLFLSLSLSPSVSRRPQKEELFGLVYRLLSVG